MAEANREEDAYLIYVRCLHREPTHVRADGDGEERVALIGAAGNRRGDYGITPVEVRDEPAGGPAMIEYDVAVTYNTEGIKSELRQRGEEQWRLVYGYQQAPGMFGFSDGGHVLVFMREDREEGYEFESNIGSF